MVLIFLARSGTPSFLLVLSFRVQRDKKTLDDSLTTASVPLTGSSVLSCNDGRQMRQLGGVGRFNHLDPSKQKPYIHMLLPGKKGTMTQGILYHA